MNSSFHYLVMAEQAMVQRALLARIKGSGLTLGQPKVLDYLKDHNGCQPERHCRRLPHRSRFSDIHPEPHGRKGTGGTQNAPRQPAQFLCFPDRKGGRTPGSRHRKL